MYHKAFVTARKKHLPGGEIEGEEKRMAKKAKKALDNRHEA